MKLLSTSALCALSLVLTTIVFIINVPTVRATSFRSQSILLAQLPDFSPIAGQSGNIRLIDFADQSDTTSTMSETTRNALFSSGVTDPLAYLHSQFSPVLGYATESGVLSTADSRQETTDDVQADETNKVTAEEVSDSTEKNGLVKIQVPSSTPMPIANPIQNSAPVKPVKKSASKPVVKPLPKPIKQKPMQQEEKSEPTAQPTPAVVEISDKTPLYQKYGAQYGVDPVIMQKIASCESGERAGATNGPYGGMFQFVASTWSSNRKAMGENPDPALRFNAEEAVKTAAFKMSRDGYGAWPACSKKVLAQVGA